MTCCSTCSRTLCWCPWTRRASGSGPRAVCRVKAILEPVWEGECVEGDGGVQARSMKCARAGGTFGCLQSIDGKVGDVPYEWMCWYIEIEQTCSGRIWCAYYHSAVRTPPPYICTQCLQRFDSDVLRFDSNLLVSWTSGVIVVTTCSSLVHHMHVKIFCQTLFVTLASHPLLGSGLCCEYSQPLSMDKTYCQCTRRGFKRVTGTCFPTANSRYAARHQAVHFHRDLALFLPSSLTVTYSSCWTTMRRLALHLTLAVLLSTDVRAFYLPGAAPHNFQDGERVEVFVNALTPMIGATENGKLVSCNGLLLLRMLTSIWPEIHDKL